MSHQNNKKCCDERHIVLGQCVSALCPLHSNEDINPEYEYLKDGLMTSKQVDDAALGNFSNAEGGAAAPKTMNHQDNKNTCVNCREGCLRAVDNFGNGKCYCRCHSNEQKNGDIKVVDWPDGIEMAELKPAPEHKSGEAKCVICKKNTLVTSEEVRTGYCNPCIYGGAAAPTSQNTDDWEEQFDELVLREYNATNFPQIKSFIKSLITQREEKAVAEHDAKWHPINDKMQMENLHGYKEGRQSTLKEVIEIAEGMVAEEPKRCSCDNLGECQWHFSQTRKRALTTLITRLQEEIK